MQVVILAAGRGTRMGRLTDDLPKPLHVVAGKTLLEHKLEALPTEIDEVVIVVGYLKERIREACGKRYGRLPIRYVTQQELCGTGDALWQAKRFLGEHFMVMMGDDLYGTEDMKRCLRHPLALLAEETRMPTRGAKVVTDAIGHLIEIKEGVDIAPGELRNAGLYILTSRIFEYPLVPIANGEFGLPQTIVKAADALSVSVVYATSWIPITTGEDVARAEAVFKKFPSGSPPDRHRYRARRTREL